MRGEEKLNSNEVAKTAPVLFPAHRLIVANCSSILADLCEAHTDGTTPISIENVSLAVFRILLSYIYGMKISNDDMKFHAKEIIDVANRFGVTSLKLETEACFVEGTAFTMEILMELLLYAESKNCALLKVAAMDYIVKNKADVNKKLLFTGFPVTLLNDMLVAFIRSEMEDGDIEDNESHLASMRINELRKKAQERV